VVKLRAAYVDTMGIVKWVEGAQLYRNAYNRLATKIASNQLVCYTSPFAVMEALDQLKENEYYAKQMRKGLFPSTIQRDVRFKMSLDRSQLRNVSGKIGTWRTRARPIIGVTHLSNNPIQAAAVHSLSLDISLNSAIHAPDALHVAWALILGCDCFLTGDEHLKHEINKYFKPRSKMYSTIVRSLCTIKGVTKTQLLGGKRYLIQARGFKNL
jgi:predicted nucleic acid-binding protein